MKRRSLHWNSSYHCFLCFCHCMHDHDHHDAMKLTLFRGFFQERLVPMIVEMQKNDSAITYNLSSERPWNVTVDHKKTHNIQIEMRALMSQRWSHCSSNVQYELNSERLSRLMTTTTWGCGLHRGGISVPTTVDQSGGRCQPLTTLTASTATRN